MLRKDTKTMKSNYKNIYLGKIVSVNSGGYTINRVCAIKCHEYSEYHIKLQFFSQLDVSIITYNWCR